MHRHFLSKALFVATLVVLAGACGGGDDDDEPSGSGGSGAGSGGKAGSNATGGEAGTGTGTGGAPAGTCLPEGELQVTNSGNNDYIIDGLADPELTLCRGRTYTFVIDAPGHPFWIKDADTEGSDDAYDSGVTNNGADEGEISFEVSEQAPDTLWYRCGVHPIMSGTILVVDL